MLSAAYSLLGVLLLIGAFLIVNARMTLNSRVVQAKEASRPANIELTLITPNDCSVCIDGNELLKEIEKQDVRILNSETFSAESEEGSTLIETYGITRVPAILVRGEYNKQNVQALFASFKGQEQDGTLVVQVSQPVYVDVLSGQSVGLVDVTYLTDASCPDCYDPLQHKAILVTNFGLTIQSEQTIDIRSTNGRALMNQYDIIQTPTVLLSSQAMAYDRLAPAWTQVGTIEEDGTFVFRENAALGEVVYKNLETNEIIRPQLADQ